MSLAPIQTSNYNSRGKRRTSATQTHTAHLFGAPVGGIDVTQTLVGADPSTAIRLENLIPRVYGCELRNGYSRWATGMAGEVRSIMPYVSPTGQTNLFAATSEGKVYDITSLSDSTPPLAFEDITGLVDGEWYYINFTNDAGHFLLAVCDDAGYWIYNGTTWTKVLQGTSAGQIDGTNPMEFSYIFQWKGRVWFIDDVSAVAWYLPYGQITGHVTKFNFGPLMPHGGELAIGANWTMDGGDGMDDKLVLFGRNGDVIIYEGTDPDTASTFRMVGRWYIGHLPGGRRCVSRYSDDLTVLSERGLCFLSELLRGQGFFQNATIAKRVNSALAKEVGDNINGRYWELIYLPHEQLLMINTPTASARDTQWVYEVNTKAFCTLVGMPMLCVEVADRHTFFGDAAGNVWLAFDGASDGAAAGQQGADLEGEVVTAFMPLGEAIRLKTFLLARPAFLAPTPPAVKVAMNADWSFLAPQGSPAFSPAAGASLWNSAQWNQSVWGGTEQSYGAWVGVAGLGFYGSLAMKVRGSPGTVFVSWQAVVTPGGIL